MQKKFFYILLIVALTAATALPVFAEKPSDKGNGKEFVTEPGYDEWGYNYRAHMFSGDYCDAYEGAAWCQPYVGTNLIMKWNDAWLSSSDLNDDGELDRHFGHDSYIGSGAWLTNHMSGVEDGQRWVYFAKIVAKDTAEQECGVDANGEPLQIWNDFCVVQEVQSGVGVYNLTHPGLGH